MSEGSEEDLFHDIGSDFDFDSFSQDCDIFDDVFDSEDDRHDLQDDLPESLAPSSSHSAAHSAEEPFSAKRLSSSPSSLAAQHHARPAKSAPHHFQFAHPPMRVGNGPQFQVLEDSEVRTLCNAALGSVIEFYPVSRIVALQLLKKNKWDSEKVINHLVDSAPSSATPGATADAHVQSVQSRGKKQKIGSGRRKYGPSDTADCRHTCLICFESVELESCWAPGCGHTYCRDCWANYFNLSIRDGEMFIECMEPSCHDLINGRDVEKFVTLKTFQLYQKIFYRQYVNDHPWMHNCPAPGCERVIKLTSPLFIPSLHSAVVSASTSSTSLITDSQSLSSISKHTLSDASSSPSSKQSSSSSTSLSSSSSSSSSSSPSSFLSEPEDHSVPIRCACGALFCFLCREIEVGDHTPATCQQVQRWLEKVSSEAENVNWIIANTKKCPKCRAPIEKNGGCMHMTCSPAHGGCGHQWCWLCWGPWSEHGTSTGGFYHCNKYDSSAAKAHDMKTSDVRTDLETYMFYFHRYDSHRNAGRVAFNQLASAEKTGFHFQEKFNVRAADTKFLQEATQQLLENRRALQWSYVYGYYLRLSSTQGSAERNLFEYLQEDLEKYTNELSNTFEGWSNVTAENFVVWKENLANYTRVTSKFLQNFTSGLQAGLTKSTQ